MTRQIKFRAWDSEKEEWCINLAVGNILYEIHANKHHDLNDTFVLSQYTGLKDKNGNDIYEGDIIEIRHPFKERYYRGKIFFTDGHFIAELFNFPHQDNPSDFVESIEYTEVIGNIYQNKELIK